MTKNAAASTKEIFQNIAMSFAGEVKNLVYQTENKLRLSHTTNVCMIGDHGKFTG